MKIFNKIKCKLGFHKPKYVPGKFEYPRNYHFCWHCDKIIIKKTT